jgi:hypothetical protein
MVEKVQLVSDLQGIVRSARGSSVSIDVATLVGLGWGSGGTVLVGAFEAALEAVPDADVLLRLDGTTMKFLDSATGTVEYASVEVP